MIRLTLLTSIPVHGGRHPLKCSTFVKTTTGKYIPSSRTCQLKLMHDLVGKRVYNGCGLLTYSPANITLGKLITCAAPQRQTQNLRLNFGKGCLFPDPNSSELAFKELEDAWKPLYSHHQVQHLPCGVNGMTILGLNNPRGLFVIGTSTI